MKIEAQPVYLKIREYEADTILPSSSFRRCVNISTGTGFHKDVWTIMENMSPRYSVAKQNSEVMEELMNGWNSGITSQTQCYLKWGYMDYSRNIPHIMIMPSYRMSDCRLCFLYLVRRDRY
jgi:hypothetical protein